MALPAQLSETAAASVQGPRVLTPRVLMFLGLACVPSWIVAGVFAASGAHWDSMGGRAVAMTYGMAPAAAALLVRGLIYRDLSAADFGLSLRLNRWLLLGWLLPVLLVGTALAVSAGLPGARLALTPTDFWDYYRARVPASELSRLNADAAAQLATGSHPALRVLLSGLVGGIFPASILALGQELGWRGFLHHELRGLGLRRPFIVAALWALWYAPLGFVGFTFPDAAVVGALLLGALCVPLSVLLGALREKSGSVFPGAIAMGTLSAVGPLAAILTRATPTYLTGIYGVAGFLAASVLAAATGVREFRGHET